MINLNSNRSTVSRFFASLNGCIRKNIWLRAVRESLLPRNSKLRDTDKLLTCYISCSENDKVIANDCAKLLNKFGFRCIISAGFEREVDIDLSRNKAFTDADRCLVVVTSEYLEELKRAESNAARDYDLIRDELSSYPKGSKIVLWPLVNALRDLPDCLMTCSCVPQVELLSHWVHILVRFLIKFICPVLAEYLVRFLAQSLLPSTDEGLHRFLVECLLQYLRDKLVKSIKYSKL